MFLRYGRPGLFTHRGRRLIIIRKFGKLTWWFCHLWLFFMRLLLGGCFGWYLSRSTNILRQAFNVLIILPQAPNMPGQVSHNSFWTYFIYILLNNALDNSTVRYIFRKVLIFALA